MLNNLLLTVIMILSLSLAFYCVDFHKENILTMVNTDKESIKPIVIHEDENLSKEAVKVVKSSEKIYVEVLAREDKNESQIVIKEAIPTKQVKIESKAVIEKIEPQIKIKPHVIEKIKVEPVEEIKVVAEKTEPQEKIEVKQESKKSSKNETVSEYSDAYKLDDLEKKMLEELKKEKRD